ncbi:MAG: hypothetical protein ACTHNS_06845 [Marmoricola sp.]
MSLVRNRSRGRRAPAWVALLAAGAALLVAGCGSTTPDSTSHPTSGSHVMSDGSTMSDAEMDSMPGMSPSAGTGDEHSGDSADARPAPGDVAHFTAGPSTPAAMICSAEVADAVRRNFALPSDAAATDAWQPPTYRCDYALPHGALHLSVRDLRTGPAATAWFRHVQSMTAGAHRITGLQGLGLPSFESPGGQVGFLKDGRTLVVDASDVAKADLPPGFSRTGVAYGVAAAVIACWSE